MGVPLDRRGESVATLRDRLDRIGQVRLQHLADGRDLHRQVGVLDEGLRPHRCEQFLLLEHRAVVPHQHVEQVEGLRAERHAGAVPRQDVFTGAKLERTEPVGGSRHLEFVCISFDRS